MIRWLAAVGILLLLAGNSSLAAKPQSGSLVMIGGVVSPGEQNYSEKGGQLVSAFIFGTPVDPKTSVFHLSLHAKVAGLSGSGSAAFDFKVMSPRGDTVEVNGSMEITGITPAVMFPLGCTPGVDCTGAIPAFFNGTGKITIEQGGVSDSMWVGMAFESPYLNPFGGPLLFMSSGGEIFGEATYTQGTISWIGVHMGGTVMGSIGGTRVSGNFGMAVNSYEDLKSGTETDSGVIGFTSMNVSEFDSVGTFLGTSKIPKQGGTPCVGFPAGTCFVTGLTSSGMFRQTTASGDTLMGSYATTWTSPAVGFSSVVAANLK